MSKRAKAPRMPRTPIPDATDDVRTEWLRRVEAEYRSSTVTIHLTHWLMQIAASPDLIRAGLRIVEDELVHSELSYLAFTTAGGDATPALARETLQIVRRTAEPLEHDVTRVATDTFCLGETVAVPLFKTMRAGCTVPDARRVLDRVLRDEIRHRDFGWALLTYMLDLPMGDTLRAMIARELPAYFFRIRRNYGGAIEPSSEIPEASRAWGLISVAEYIECVERTFVRDWRPRFARLGIDAETAWATASRGGREIAQIVLGMSRSS